VIFAGSDTMILGASEVFESKNLLKNKILIGFDGILEVQKKILEGKVAASVQQETSVLGATAIDKVKKYFENEKTEESVVVPPKLITRSYRIDALSLKDLEMF
jgi:ABC-type sugar transport system substrate-binding protein